MAGARPCAPLAPLACSRLLSMPWRHRTLSSPSSASKWACSQAGTAARAQRSAVQHSIAQGCDVVQAAVLLDRLSAVQSRLGAVVRRCMQARSLTGSELMPSGSVVVAGTGCSRPSCAAEQGRAAPLSSPHQSMHRKGQPGQDRLQAQGSASPEACRACEASCSDRTWPTTSTQVPSGWQVTRRICCQPRRPLLPAWHRTSAPRSTDRPAACAASLSAGHNSSMKVGSMFNGTDAGASNQEAGGRRGRGLWVCQCLRPRTVPRQWAACLLITPRAAACRGCMQPAWSCVEPRGVKTISAALQLDTHCCNFHTRLPRIT